MWCIYKTTNLVNGKTYIGQHKYSKLNDGYIGSGRILKKAIKKYGKNNFKTEYLLTEIPSRRLANIAETNCISLARRNGKAEYNICNGGQGRSGEHSDMIGNQYAKGKNIGNQYAKGNRLSRETRERMGKSRLGNTNNGCAYIKCIETGKVLRTREWIKQGFGNAYQVARGRQKSCKGYHFEYCQFSTT